MNESLTKKDLTSALSELTTIMMSNFDQVHESLDDMKSQTDLVEKHDRRIEELEKRNRVIKNILEKDLHAKVAW